MLWSRPLFQIFAKLILDIDAALVALFRHRLTAIWSASWTGRVI
jgi:hypothetical protein